MARPSRSDEEKGKRSRRVPLNSFRTKLHIPEDQLEKGFHYRWFKDVGGRVEQAQNAGFDFVLNDGKIQVGEREGNTDVGSRISILGGDDPRKPEGSYRMVLMRQPMEFYEEDQKEKQDRIDGLSAQINRNLDGVGDRRVDNAYKPSASVYRS